MDNFFDQFKENLENQSPPPFDGKDWEDMQERLEQQAFQPTLPSSTGHNYWAWASGFAALLVIGMIGSHWLLFQKIQQANTRISQLERQLKDKNNTSQLPTTIYKIDTVYQGQFQIGQVDKSTTNTSNVSFNRLSNLSNTTSIDSKISTFPSTTTIDTDLKNKYAPTIINKSFPTIESSPTILLKKGNNTTSQTIEKNQKSWRHTTAVQQSTIAKIANTFPTIKKGNKTLNTEEEEMVNSLDFLKALPFPLDSVPIESLLKIESPNITNTDPKSIFHLLRPSKVELGTFIGFSRIPIRGIENSNINTTELIAQVQFTSAFRIWGAIQQGRINYTADTEGYRFGVPTTPAPSGNHQFQEAYIERKSLSADFGLLYSSNRSSKWNPFVGVGLGTNRLLKNLIRYQFTDNITDQRILESVQHPNGDADQYILFKVGVTHWLKDKWAIQLQGNYQYFVKEKSAELPSMLNVRLGVLYAF